MSDSMSDSINTASAAYDLYSDDFLLNPYPVYQQLLEEAPVYWSDETEMWYVSRHSMIQGLFRDTRLSSNRVAMLVRSITDEQKQFIQPMIDVLAEWILFLDPPEHTAIRRSVNKAFSLKTLNGMETRIHELVNECLTAVEEKGSFEVITDFAYPLPATVIAEMLGADPSDSGKFRQWSNDIACFLGEKTDASMALQCQQSILETQDYLRHVVKRYKQNPQDNLMKNLLKLQDDEPTFTEDRLIANCVGLIFAGHETTTNLIANGLLSLLKHPDQLQALRDDPDLISSTVEESLRYEAPVQRLGRAAVADIELGDTCIKAGDRVMLLVGAANRDPEAFENPQQFLIDRKSSPHFTFGHGLHHCSGAALGRLETRIAISAVINRFPSLALIDEQPDWKMNFGLRSLNKLPLNIG